MDKQAKYNLYYDLLIEWNNKFNLTTITERGQVDLLHFADSLSAQQLIPEKSKLLDVGSGAGFPGIPLKIERDDIDVTLIDSVGKKITFLSEVISRLGLSKIKAIHSRIEDHKEFDYDIVVSRAVAPLNTLVEYCLPFVKKGGLMIAYKGARNKEEEENALGAITMLGGMLKEVKKIELGKYDRNLYLIEKVNQTPSGYPRGGNKPRLKPLNGRNK